MMKLPECQIKRRRRQYREASIMDHEGIPDEAREKYTKGLEEITNKIMAVPEIPDSWL